MKTYGNADFPVGATSTNTTIPLTYSSSNTSVAIIVGNTIRITGAGTAIITVSQAGNAGYFPAADVQRTLTVNKVNLTVRVMDTTRLQGQANPVFRVTYTGFVLGETETNLSTIPVISTTAETHSLHRVIIHLHRAEGFRRTTILFMLPAGLRSIRRVVIPVSISMPS